MKNQIELSKNDYNLLSNIYGSYLDNSEFKFHENEIDNLLKADCIVYVDEVKDIFYLQYKCTDAGIAALKEIGLIN